MPEGRGTAATEAAEATKKTDKHTSTNGCQQAVTKTARTAHTQGPVHLTKCPCSMVCTSLQLQHQPPRRTAVCIQQRMAQQHKSLPLSADACLQLKQNSLYLAACFVASKPRRVRAKTSQLMSAYSLSSSCRHEKAQAAQRVCERSETAIYVTLCRGHACLLTHNSSKACTVGAQTRQLHARLRLRGKGGGGRRGTAA